ncbi:MAG: CDGSH iron-sulfur domain-containing protein [Coriobacteriia bacterium]|nr:CDGSH iron-sulfur domain-containing protein [Coriobacteriia bacterium]
MKITVAKDGPYLVSGNIPLLRGEIVTDEDGFSVDIKELETLKTAETYALCRCGHSANKPFCDGSHVKAGFQGQTTATHESHDSKSTEFKDAELTLLDDMDLCISARFCDRGIKVWNYVKQSDDPDSKKDAINEACLCPSGRLVVFDADNQPIETKYEPSIMILEDPSKGLSSAYFVRGGIPVVDEDGNEYEIRNRQTICRCGGSHNKPFCDGTHYSVGFNDGAVST